MAYVLARENPQGYVKVLRSAERALECVIQPVIKLDSELNRVYAALDDPTANCCDAVASMLASSAETWMDQEAAMRMKHLDGLNARFDASEREVKDSQEGDPGIGN